MQMGLTGACFSLLYVDGVMVKVTRLKVLCSIFKKHNY